MKIVVIGPSFRDSFARNICVTLTAMGHDVVNLAGTRTLHFQSRLVRGFWAIAPKLFPSIEAKDAEQMIRAAKRVEPDLILVTIGDLSPDTVAALRAETKAPVVCWYTDAMANWARQYLLAAPWDAIFVKEPNAVRVLKDMLGQRAFYLPEAMNPMWHRPVEPTAQDHRKYDCDLLAQGTLHYYRARMLEPFVDYDLKVWGANNPPWIHSKTKRCYTNIVVAEETKAKAFSCAKIALNIVSHLEFEGVNCSLFEYAGCGLFQIAEMKPSLAGVFKPEEEIVTYRDRQELKEKVEFYLAHPDLRTMISAQAAVRAQREHTYEVRLRELLQILFDPNYPMEIRTPTKQTSWSA
jgi:spore maturation protein CgeB